MTKKQFVIRLSGLEVGKHLYEFKVDDTFFESFDDSVIAHANLKVEVILLKHNSITTLTFVIDGTLQSVCDRCTAPFDIEIHATEEMHLRYGNPDEPHPDNVLVLPNGENELDISAPLHEFITLAIPARKVPCEEDSTFVCDNETLNKLNHISISEAPKKVDSPWEKLKNINFNDN
ncbi:MAG: DUF177 domain-containing protein [Bacteroidetes bacterium]|nr:DUF177 domain-containing protein [Bacteroidota bacterium]